MLLAYARQLILKLISSRLNARQDLSKTGSKLKDIPTFLANNLMSQIPHNNSNLVKHKQCLAVLQKPNHRAETWFVVQKRDWHHYLGGRELGHQLSCTARTLPWLPVMLLDISA